ncbi:MAG TPA: SDR family oxidoreductase [Acidimicrobiia bacterium]|nr:SDR family oxidoreductase [Acidimicrobiia bacterium]
MVSALVTGATSGIGLASALALADAGWWVLATGMESAEGANVARQLEQKSGGAFIAGDLTDPEIPSALIKSVVDTTGSLDLLVNNAGIHFAAGLDRLDLDEYDNLLAINLRAPVLMAKLALEVMLAQGSGVIINIASEAGLVAVPGQVAYNISKAGLIMLTRSLTADYAARGIRAVSICPGTTRTPLVEKAIASAPDPEAHERMLAASRPAHRLGRPEEIAAAVVFAASDVASYLNGTEIVIDGGYTVV